MPHWFISVSLVAALAGCVISDDKFCEGPSDERWFKYRDYCYYLGTGKANQVSYYDAEDFCRSKGSYLASVHSDAENQFLVHTFGHYYFRLWIGLNILEEPGKYEWSDGQPVDYHNFVTKDIYRKESCFVLLAKDGGGWRQEHCEMKYFPICKRPDSDVTPSPLPPFTPKIPEGNCPKEWIQFGQKCYRFYGADETERLFYKDAKQACMSLGENHDLVSIHSMEEQAFLTQHLYKLDVPTWIGFTYIWSDIVGHNSGFGWTDNSRVNFTYWAPYYKSVGLVNCAYLSVQSYGKGYWLADMCDWKKHAYICQRPPDASIPEKEVPVEKCADKISVKYRDSCYRYFPAEQYWSEAENTCEMHGGHLVSINDAYEQNFIYGMLSSKPESIWIGLKNVETTRIFKWVNGEPVYYSNWAESQPDLSHVESSCISTSTADDLQWNATKCDIPRPFICETSKDAVNPLTEDIIGDCPAFESSWIDIGDSYCYHQGQGEYARMAWCNNFRYCLTRGMEMISIHSEHQMKSLYSYFWKGSSDAWLNLIRTFDRKSFMWVDGSNFNFTNWAFREPDGWTTQNDCVSLSVLDLNWKTVNCANGMLNLCRVKKISRGS